MEKIGGENFNFEYYDALLKKRAARAKLLKIQATEHQQNAIETCEKLGEQTARGKGIIFSMFKRYHNYDLIQCREWVLARKFNNPAKAFVTIYHKRFKH